MCTVTYIPGPDAIHLTSNRDEHRRRSPALPPGIHSGSTGPILFPRDADAGGTWVAVHGNGNAAVLLNGAFHSHVPDPPYRRSRGLILLDLLDSFDPPLAFRGAYLDRIEPFTAIVYSGKVLYECRWDGKEKHIRLPDRGTPHIWSSVTLYGSGAMARRTQWFEDFLTGNPDPAIEDIMHFHSFTGDGDPHNDLRMNRDGQVFTVSITCLSMHSEYGQMLYLDLPTGNASAHTIPFEPSTAPS
jgi:hypothetical protein